MLSMSKRISFLRAFVLLVVVALGLYLLLSLVGGIVLMEGAMRMPRRPLTQRNVLEALVAPLAADGVEDVSMTAADGAILRAWYVRPRQANGSTVLLLHGVADNRQGMSGYAPMFLRAGYAVLLPDSREHGESGGAHATYGLIETDDVRRWWMWARGRVVSADSSAKGCTYLLGESMGAAIALEAATAPDVCAVVAEAPFASFREIGYERIAQGLGTSIGVSHATAWPLIDVAFLYARLRYGLHFDEASPEQRLAASHVPALLISGLADDNIPTRHSERIMRLAMGNCELWLVPGAGHTTAASVDPAEFQRRVLGWFASHSRRIN
jgi:alpha-beta hydrolase superfamily lysophospholipase